MIPQIVTASDSKYKKYLELLLTSVKNIRNDIFIYDLGDLGFGESFKVKDENFISKGYYCKGIAPWPSRGLHKPDLIAHHIKTYKNPFIYVDCDTIFKKTIEMKFNFHLGLTKREKPLKVSPEHWINAGVMFINSEKCLNLIYKWKKMTENCQNDQLALNRLYEKHKEKIKTFPLNLYNSPSWDEGLIFHFHNKYKYPNIKKQLDKKIF